MKYIPGYERRYSVTSGGLVYSHRRNKYLKPVFHHGRYEMVSLYNADIKQRMYFMHRLVAMTYLSNPKRLPFVNHIDGDRRNNDVSNLEWCTAQHNIRDMMRRGAGVALATRKLTDEQAKQVREKYLEGYTVREIAKEFGLSSTSTHKIIQGYHYKILRLTKLNR